MFCFDVLMWCFCDRELNVLYLKLKDFIIFETAIIYQVVTRLRILVYFEYHIIIFRPLKHVKHCFQFLLQQHHERKYICQNIGGQGFSSEHY